MEKKSSDNSDNDEKIEEDKKLRSTASTANAPSKSGNDKDKDEEKASKRKPKKSSSKRGAKVEEPEAKNGIPSPKAKDLFQTPKDEPDMTLLQLEPELAKTCRLFEEYKIAMQQIHALIIQLMRRGNTTTDLETIKSEKGQAAPEKLVKSIFQSHVFWRTASEFQPQLNEAVRGNCVPMAAAERNMQEKGPKHLKRIKKFVYKVYPQYVDLKKELQKVIGTTPVNVQAKEEICRKISTMIQENYADAKHLHVGELQCAFMELMLFSRSVERCWFNIAEKRTNKNVFSAESFDFGQFFPK